MPATPADFPHRYALVMAGGSGTRLWPMSRANLPKQLIPFIAGRSLLQLSMDRLEPLISPQRRYVCAGQSHRAPILEALPALGAERFIGEPVGRDTLNAVGLSAAVIARADPQAVIAVFTADHVIEPADRFREIVAKGFAVAESMPNALVTFGIAPTHAATGYGYLELGSPLDLSSAAGAAGPRLVSRFQEKPDAATAARYLSAGPQRYLWNSGMFIWRAATLLDCLRRYEPAGYAALMRIAQAWDAPGREALLGEIYPGLKRISVDYAIMEPGSKDPTIRVVAVPMPLSWLDIGSWPSFAQICPKDAEGNSLAAATSLLLDTKNTLVASNEAGHLIAAIGCSDLLIVHTPQATLVCRADKAEDIKALYAQVAAQFGAELL